MNAKFLDFLKMNFTLHISSVFNNSLNVSLEILISKIFRIGPFKIKIQIKLYTFQYTPKYTLRIIAFLCKNKSLFTIFFAGKASLKRKRRVHKLIRSLILAHLRPLPACAKP